jgi:methionine sulfoxide reductase heme-binding subunit
MSTDALWYVGRGTGIASLLLLTVVVALGIATRSGRAIFGLPRFAVAAVHRTASLTAVVFLVIHVGSLYLDPYAQLHLVDVVVPFTGAYRPFWLGLGTVGLDLIAALVVTSLLRHRIGRRTWRAVHWLAYLSWPVAVSHALGNGTDNSTWWLRGIAAACTLAVLGAVGWRVSERFQEYGDARVPLRPSNGSAALPAERRVEFSQTGRGVR